MNRTRMSVAALLAAALLVPGAAASAASQPANEPDDTTTATTQPEGPGAPGGEEPVDAEPTDGGTAGASESEDPFGPEPYEKPWTWYLGFVLTAAALGIVGLLGFAYWLLVLRPARKQQQGESH